MGCQQSVPLTDGDDDKGLLGTDNNNNSSDRAAYNMKSAVPKGGKSKPQKKDGGGGGGKGKEKAPSSNHNEKKQKSGNNSNNNKSKAPPQNKQLYSNQQKPPQTKQPGPPMQQHGNMAKPPPSPQKLPSASKPINRAIDRVDAIDKSRQIKVGNGIKLTYAYLSQRGFYPDDPFKANQDAYCVSHEINAGKQNALFGVFDGHGTDGDGCAIYAKQNLPVQLKTTLSKTPPKAAGTGRNDETTGHSRDQIQSSLKQAHIEVNKSLHKNAKIDDSLSGTTAITIYFHGRRNRITIANVGDSRAVLGQVGGGKGSRNPDGTLRESARTNLKALPLSRDQTPYRKDEKKRVQAAGARVLSLDQLEGLEPILEGQSENNEDGELELGEELDEGGDPPRVWAQNGDYPGTAFTRSIGDSVAEELGVFAEPEMLTREVTPEDKIIVLASDGVFEFLTNQSVIDICAKFTDPLEACRAVVAEAYELWLQYELRTDDITIICMFIDEVKPVADRRGSLGSSFSSNLGTDAPNTPTASALAVDGGDESSDDDVDTGTLTTEGLRPVRKHASKEKSKAIKKWKELGKTLHHDDADDSTFNWKEHATEKTEAEKRSIADAIRASVMFRNTSDEQKAMIYACMESVPVKAGTWVIRQGTVGDRFYIVDEGQFEVRIVPDGEDDETGQGGHIVHIYEGSREKHAHPSFGELALVRWFLCTWGFSAQSQKYAF